MPRISKKFALLLVLAMLATMFVGMGTVSAAASYSAGSVVSTSTGNHDLGRFKVAIPATELQNNDWVDLRLPSDFKFNIPDGTGKAIVSAGAGVYTVAGGAGFDLEFPSVKNAFTNGVLVGNITVDKLGDAEVKINFANPAALVATTTEDTAYFYVNLNSIYVDSSSPASVQVNVSGNSGSCFVDGAVTVATYGSGTVNLSIDSVKTITDSISGIDNIRIKEDRPGAWNVYDTIKLKLPNGFVWAAAPTAATISSIDGTDIHAGILADINGDSGRTLKLTNNLANTTTAAYVMIKSLAINVDDETIAKTGDVVIDVSGTATSAPSSFTAAKYGDYTVTASAVGDPTQVVAGGVQQKIGKFAIEESVKESLSTNKSIILTLVGGAKWDISNNYVRQDTTLSKNWGTPFTGAGVHTWAMMGTEGDAIKYVLGDTKSTDAIKAVFEKGEIAVSPNADSQIKIVISGTAGVTGEIIVANVVKPAAISTEGGAVESPIGLRTIAINPILVTESIKEGINFNPNAADSSYKSIRIEFPQDVVPSLPTAVEVTVGDAVVNDSLVATSLASTNGKWGIDIPIKSTSTTPATIKVSGVKLDVLRSVPEGDILAALKGGAIIKTAVVKDSWQNVYYPGTAAIASTPVVKITTQAPQNSVKQAVFTVGSTSYTLNGVAQTADVAPYIKSDRTYVPIRYLAIALGVDSSNIMWDEASQTVTLMRGDGKIVQLKIGSTIIYINGTPVNMDVAPEITNDRTFLPAAYVAQAMGALVTWDAATNTVTIK